MKTPQTCFRDYQRTVSLNTIKKLESTTFYFLYFSCHHPVGAFVISTSQTLESVHTSTWSFKYNYTGKEGLGGGEARI